MKVKHVYSEWDVNSFEEFNPNAKIVSVTVLKNQVSSLEYANDQQIPVIREIVGGYVIVYEEIK